MKKKTVSGVTALTMLASATIPVYAAPIEEMVNTKGLNNAISTERPAVYLMDYYTSFNETDSSNLEGGTVINDTEPTIEEVEPDAEGWLKATTFTQLNYLWNYSIDKDNNRIILESFKGINNHSDDVKVEIPRVVEGYKVALANLNTKTFPNVTHIRVTDDGEEQVKVLAEKLTHGFRENDTLKYVDLEGLNVSGVTDMQELFSMCSNLRVIKIIDWVIRDKTSIMGMFYAKSAATEEDKKILVITNSNRIAVEYDFVASNRIPYITTFSGEGGHFLGDKEILNMKIARFTIHPEDTKDLEVLAKYDVSRITDPVREGYEFKGWYTEDPTPTNIYELLDMTYKAKWEKVVEGEKPEQPPVDEDMIVDPDKDQVVENKPTTLPDDNPNVGTDNPFNDGDNVGDDMEVDPDKDQVVDDKPTTLPDDVPVEEDDKTDEGENGDTTPPTVTPQPPVDNVPTNGIENLKDLDKELQEKVDSIIAEVIMKEGSLSLNITGDDKDIVHVKEIEVTEEGIFTIVDGEKLKFGVALDGLKLDLTNTRAVRIEANKYSAVPHQYINGGLKISSGNLENILITSKVKEPFIDVEDKHWFKGYVEEVFNYGITLGTSATTFSPYLEITRAEFAVMIARALELKSENVTGELKDIKGKWYQNEVQALYEAEIVTGFGDGTFGGEKKVTREQASTMLGRMLEHVGVDTKVKEDVQFADMDQIGNYAKQSIQFLASNGVLVNGRNTKFNPLNNLTRAEMAKMLVRSLRLSDIY